MQTAAVMAFGKPVVMGEKNVGTSKAQRSLCPHPYKVVWSGVLTTLSPASFQEHAQMWGKQVFSTAAKSKGMEKPGWSLPPF